MREIDDKRFLPKKRRGGVAVVLVALILAAAIPLGLILGSKYLDFSQLSPLIFSHEETQPEQTPAPPPTATPEPTPAPTPNPYRQVEQSAQVEQSYFDDAVFFGDSLTDGVRVYPGMSNAQVIAATGVNPDSVLTKQVIAVPGNEKRITMIAALQAAAPRKIYIMLGANWVGENTGVTETAFLEHYRSMLERIKTDHPHSIIYLQSMLPVTEKFAAGNKAGLNNQVIDASNQMLQSLAEELNMYYLDVASVIKGPTGSLPEEASSDGMHLTAEYYEKWFAYLRTHTVQPTEDQETGQTEQSGEEPAQPAQGEPQVIEPAPDSPASL